MAEIYHRISGEDVLDEDLARVQQDMAVSMAGQEHKVQAAALIQGTGDSTEASCQCSGFQTGAVAPTLEPA